MPNSEHGHAQRAPKESLSDTATTGAAQGGGDDASAVGIDATSCAHPESNLDPGRFDHDLFPAAVGDDFGDDDEEELPVGDDDEHGLSFAAVSAPRSSLVLWRRWPRRRTRPAT